jgi:hypothetical protein
MKAELTQWQGRPPESIRVNLADYLALTECGYIRDGRLSGDGLEIKPG